MPLLAVDIGGEIMLDPSLDEDTIASARLTVISGSQGALSGMQKSGTGTLSAEDIYRIVNLATSKAKQIREHVFGDVLSG